MNDPNALEQYRSELDPRIDDLVSAFGGLPDSGMCRIGRLQAATIALVHLEYICAHQNDDPLPQLRRMLDTAQGIAQAAAVLQSDMRPITSDGASSLVDTRSLFEAAWTTYSDATFDHSLGLVQTRLRLSGFDAAWFRGKRCFDGGCGTGRLAVAMALGGAERVVAADIGGESLEYLRRVVERYKLTNVEIVEEDITNLSRWPDESFDFVASNGVLHHTKRPEHGLIEHFRITRRSGVFWLYLYGAGGLYWHVYDRLRPLVSAFSAREIRSWLTTFGLREGLIYTFLDNLCAPRTYHDTDDVLDLLRARGRLSWRHARGQSVVDDTTQLLASKYGPLIYGPNGEVRIIICKET